MMVMDLSSFYRIRLPSINEDRLDLITKVLNGKKEIARKVMEVWGPLAFPVAKLLWASSPFDVTASQVRSKEESLKSIKVGLGLKFVDFSVEELERIISDKSFSSLVSKISNKADLTDSMELVIHQEVQGLADLFLKRLEKIRGFSKDRIDPEDVIMSFPDGMFWVDTRSCLSDRESLAMKHCGKGYFTDSKIISLRGKDKRPMLSVEYNEPLNWFPQVRGRANKDPSPELMRYVDALADRLGVSERSIVGRGELRDWRFDREHTDEILRAGELMRKKHPEFMKGFGPTVDRDGSVVINGNDMTIDAFFKKAGIKRPTQGKKVESMRMVWGSLRSLFNESKQYRGDSGISIHKIEKLVDEMSKEGSLRSDPEIDPEGGYFDCDYHFEPKIWGKWFPSQDKALAVAATDKDAVDQHAGRSQGGTTMKTTWGQRVVHMPGRARKDFEMAPSAWDTYDVLMQGEVVEVFSKKGGEKSMNGTLLRVAYSPAIGSSEDRKARLVALMAGKTPLPLPRRPQPDNPNQPRNRKSDDEVIRQQIRSSSDDEDEDGDGGSKPVLDRSGGSASNQGYKDRLNRHDREYVPTTPRNPDERNKARNSVPDDDDVLFPKRR
jgi:hypothetical protein